MSFAFFKFLYLGSLSIIDFWLSDLIGLGLGFSQVVRHPKWANYQARPDNPTGHNRKKLRCIRFHLMDQLASGGNFPNMKAFI